MQGGGPGGAILHRSERGLQLQINFKNEEKNRFLGSDKSREIFGISDHVTHPRHPNMKCDNHELLSVFSNAYRVQLVKWLCFAL